MKFLPCVPSKKETKRKNIYQSTFNFLLPFFIFAYYIYYHTIIGGSGPEAGTDLFTKVVTLHRKRLGNFYKSDRDAPNILLLSVSDLGGPRTKIDCEVGIEGYERSLLALLQTIKKILPLVDVFCVACNTLHIFESNIIELLVSMGKDPSIFISMIKSTTKVCKGFIEKGKKTSLPTNINSKAKISIVGGPGTMDLDGNSPYRRLVEDLDDGGNDNGNGNDETTTKIIYRLPTTACDTLKKVIWQIKQDGIPSEESIVEYKRFVIEDVVSNGVKVCILACTELPLIHIDDDDGLHNSIDSNSTDSLSPSSMRFIDPTEVVANELLNATQSYPGEN